MKTCIDPVKLDPHRSAPKVREIAVLGGGAVVRECFLPAVHKLGLTAKTTVVEIKAGSLAGCAIQPRVVHRTFRDFLIELNPAHYSHCIVALPNVLHFEAVKAALKRGLHVLCEKPLTLQPVTCRELALIAESQERVLAVNMVRRLFGSIQTVSQMIRHGWLGELQAIEIEHGGAYSWPVASLAPFQQENGGVLADLGIHYLDIAAMFAGRLTPIGYTDDYAGGVESECRYNLEGESGTAIKISLSRLRRLSNQLHLRGSRGTVTIGLDQFDQCTFEPRNREGRPLVVRPEGQGRTFNDYFAAQLGRFLQAEAGATNDLVNAYQAAEEIELIHWAYLNRDALRPTYAATGRVRLKGRVAVTGSTGFIGSHLVERLNSDGSEIIACYHNLQACAAISRFAVEYADADLADRESLRGALRGSRYVFHLAYGREPSKARSITVDGTKNLVEAAIAEGIEAVVVLSSMYAIGHSDGVVDESCSNRPYGGIYGKTKSEMERWCLDRAKRSGNTRIVVLLPTCVYGPRGRAYTEIPAALAKEGAFAWIEDGRGIANIVYVDNLIDAMILAARTPTAHGQRFIINDESLTWREFLTPIVETGAAPIRSFSKETIDRLEASSPRATLREVLGSMLASPEVSGTVKRSWLGQHFLPIVRKWNPRLPVRLKQSAARMGAVANPLQPSHPPAWIADLFGPTTTRFSSERARRELGWTPAIDRETALRRTLVWLAQEGLRSL